MTARRRSPDDEDDVLDLGGYTFSPPEISMSLMRSMIVTKPSSSMVADVTGVQPAVDDRLGGRFGAIPVAGHDVRAADDHLSRLARIAVRPVLAHDADIGVEEERLPSSPPARGHPRADQARRSARSR